MLHSGKSANGSTFESECLYDLRSVAARLWIALANACRSLITMPSGTYRPEVHYMRGPGPKWREKHAGTFSTPMRNANVAGIPA
jgi:hypothetical protein